MIESDSIITFSDGVGVLAPKLQIRHHRLCCISTLIVESVFGIHMSESVITNYVTFLHFFGGVSACNIHMSESGVTDYVVFFFML